VRLERQAHRIEAGGAPGTSAGGSGGRAAECWRPAWAGRNWTPRLFALPPSSCCAPAPSFLLLPHRTPVNHPAIFNLRYLMFFSQNFQSTMVGKK
jgi:hypothetical protein